MCGFRKYPYPPHRRSSGTAQCNYRTVYNFDLTGAFLIEIYLLLTDLCMFSSHFCLAKQQKVVLGDCWQVNLCHMRFLSCGISQFLEDDPTISVWRFPKTSDGILKNSKVVKFYYAFGKFRNFPKMIQPFLKISKNVWGHREEFQSCEVSLFLFDRLKKTNPWDKETTWFTWNILFSNWIKWIMPGHLKLTNSHYFVSQVWKIGLQVWYGVRSKS